MIQDKNIYYGKFSKKSNRNGGTSLHQENKRYTVFRGKKRTSHIVSLLTIAPIL
jgi:hypothetical protein